MRTDEQRRKAVEYLNRHPEQREKARARAIEHIRRKRSADPAHRRRQQVYLELAAEYGDHCAICGGQPTNGRRLAIDHCHTTDEIRGLLCNKCNLLIGHARDSVDILLAAIEYLSRAAYTGRSFAEALSVRREVSQ